jgi:hypothetical protein
LSIENRPRIGGGDSVCDFGIHRKNRNMNIALYDGDHKYEIPFIPRNNNLNNVIKSNLEIGITSPLAPSAVAAVRAPFRPSLSTSVHTNSRRIHDVRHADWGYPQNSSPVPASQMG